MSIYRVISHHINYTINMIFNQIYYTIDMMFYQIYYKMKLEMVNYIFFVSLGLYFT